VKLTTNFFEKISILMQKSFSTLIIIFARKQNDLLAGTRPAPFLRECLDEPKCIHLVVVIFTRWSVSSVHR